MSRQANTVTYGVDQGLLILVTDTTVEETGVNAGELYEFVSSWPALVRWGADDASIADGGFDFCVPAGQAIRARVPNGDTALNVIELSAESHASATMLMSLVSEEV